MKKPKIILIGAGGHAHACIDIVERQGIYDIAGLVGLRNEINKQCLVYSVIASDDDLAELINRYQYACIAVGRIQSADLSTHIFQKLTKLGFILPSIISPNAYVSNYASIGKGSLVMHGAIINAGSKIGDNCIINTRAIIEHDVIIESHCHISTGAILNGNVHVGKKSFIGSGSIVKEGILIGESCLVGMGLSLRHNLEDNIKFIGSKKA